MSKPNIRLRVGRKNREDENTEKIQKDDLEIKPNEKYGNVFREIKSIDDKISVLLIKNGINTIEKLNDTSVKELIKINGLRKNIVKKIKKEVELNIKINSSEDEESYENIEENPYIKHEDDEIEEITEWESIDLKKSN